MTAISTGAQPVRDEGRRPTGGRVARLLRGPATDPPWARPALLALLAATALLYLAGLSRNGWANDFYAAAVQAGATTGLPSGLAAIMSFMNAHQRCITGCFGRLSMW